MGTRQRLALGLLALLLLLLPQSAAAQGEAIQISATATLLPELPRRVHFVAQASSSAGDIVDARLFFYPAHGGVRSSVPVTVGAAPSVTLEHEYNLQSNGLPPGTELEYLWELTDSAGNTTRSAPQRLLTLDPRFDWQTLEDERLAIHWYAGDGAWGQEMFDTGTVALAQLQEELGATVDDKVRLVAYASGDDFRAAFPPQQEWIGGQAFTELGITVQIIGAGQRDWMQTVLFHELSHLVFHQVTDGALAPIPAWLEEGLAMYNEPGEGRGSAGEVRAAAEANALLRFSQLQGNFGADGREVGLAYAQSEMIVTYLLDDCGQEGFRTLIRNLVDEDMSVDRALEAACGYDSAELYDRWRQTLPNAPAAPDAADAPTGAPPPAPAPSSAPALPTWLLAVAVGGMCVAGIALLGIVYVLYRLLRPQRRTG